MNPFVDTLHVCLRPSSTHRMLNAGLHALSLAVILVLAAYRPVLAPLLVLVALGFWRSDRKITQNRAHSLLSLRVREDGVWRWQTVNGRWYAGECIRSHVFGSALMSVELRPTGAHWRRRHQLLWADALAADDHRRLRARLRINPPERTNDSPTGC